MKISLNWLNRYINLEDYKNSPSKLSSLLTGAGLEVEGMTDPSEHWQKVVVGRLLKVEKHPDADKLTLCQVEVGEDQPLQIVCGATNHREGDFVVVGHGGSCFTWEL